jgi:hypothetical protein
MRLQKAKKSYTGMCIIIFSYTGPLCSGNFEPSNYTNMTTNGNALLKVIITLILLLLYVITKAGNGNKNGSQQYCLEISGNVTAKHQKKKSDRYTVELIQNNKVVQSETVRDGRSFKFKLKQDGDYGILITKEGYVPRLVNVWTNLPQEITSHPLFRFEFDTDLIPESEKSALNTDALDFPIAIIQFNEETGWFYYNEEYTSHIKRKIYGKDLDHLAHNNM